MARPDREAIDTFMSITGVSEATAIQKLEQHNGNLNEAVNAHFSEGDRNIVREASLTAMHGNRGSSMQSGPSAPTIVVDVPDYSNGIEEEMIRAAIEASKKDAEMSSQQYDCIDHRIPTAQPVQSHSEDPDLAHAVSLSLQNAEQEQVHRELEGDIGSSGLEAKKSDSPEEMGRVASLNGSVIKVSSISMAKEKSPSQSPFTSLSPQFGSTPMDFSPNIPSSPDMFGSNVSLTPEDSPTAAVDVGTSAAMEGGGGVGDGATTDSVKSKVVGPTLGRVYSATWNHYKREKVDGLDKVKCNYCHKYFLGNPKQGTSHLMKHFERCSLRKNKDIRQHDLQANFNSRDIFELSPFHFNQEFSREKLAKMIIMHEYPLTMVDHEGFRIFCQSLNPCFKTLTRNTIKIDCLKIYEQEKAATMLCIEKNEGRVAVTTDMWMTSSQKKGFMAVTAHYIDNDWKMQSRIIRFTYVSCSHTSSVLCEALIDCLMDWNIDTKLSTITVDNCTTSDDMIEFMLEKLPLDSLMLGGRLIHMRCYAYILNLMVKDGLDIIGETIEEIRDSVAYWTGTPKRWEKFEEMAQQLRIPLGKKLMLDCRTQWNTTYLMLHTALDYKDVFFHLKQFDSRYKTVPTESHWNLIKEICSRLELFYNAIKLFSVTKYLTANIYFPIICEIRVALDQWISCGNEVIELMSSNMLSKFEKYWFDVYGLMGVATVLDPRYKVVMLECYFVDIYHENSEIEVEKIRILCRKLLEQYEEKERVNNDDGVVGTSSGGLAYDLVKLSKFELYASRKKRKLTRSELDLYLDEDILPRTLDFDVLSWWKSNKGKYPILSKIAKDILGIPVSTVASETAFSTGGRIVSPQRSRLNPNTIEALMCAQNWLLADVKGQSSKCHEHDSVLVDSDEEES